MSMSCYVRRVTPAQLHALRRRPDRVIDFVNTHGDVPAAPPATGLFDRIRDALGAPDPVAGVVREEGDEIDLDKSVHALHYTLVGTEGATSDPLGMLLDTAPPLADEPGGMTVMALEPDMLVAFARAANALTVDELRSRYDPEAMVANEIYMAEVLLREGEAGFDYIASNFETLKNFVNGCVQRSCGAVAYLL